MTNDQKCRHNPYTPSYKWFWRRNGLFESWKITLPFCTNTYGLAYYRGETSHSLRVFLWKNRRIGGNSSQKNACIAIPSIQKNAWYITAPCSWRNRWQNQGNFVLNKFISSIYPRSASQKKKRKDTQLFVRSLPVNLCIWRRVWENKRSVFLTKV